MAQNTTGAGTQPEASGFTGEQAAVYDRQIRLWGVEAQLRIARASILLVGSSCLLQETGKNLALAGVGRVAVCDETPWRCVPGVLTSLHESQTSMAAAAVAQLAVLNPMVQTEDVSLAKLRDDTCLSGYDVVVIGDADYQLQRGLSARCRSLGVRVVVTVSRGFYAGMFSDLLEHQYVVQGKDDVPETACVSYPPMAWLLGDALALAPGKGRRRVPSVVYALRLVAAYEATAGHRIGVDDAEGFLAYVQQQRQTGALHPDAISDEAAGQFTQWCGNGGELAPVAAILGGVLGQDVIRVVSGKDAPLCNAFVYDGIAKSGVVYSLTAPASSS